MKNEQNKLVKGSGEKRFYIGFNSLFKAFKKKIVIHFILTLLTTLFAVAFFSITSNLIESSTSDSKCSDGHTHEIISENKSRNFGHQTGDYFELLPFPIRKVLTILINSPLSMNRFVIFGVLFACIYSIFSYYDSLWESDIESETSLFLKNKLLDKFRKFTFEQKKINLYELKAILDEDKDIISESWEHIPNHFFHSAVEILLLLYTCFGGLKKVGKYSFYLFIAFNILMAAVYEHYFRKLLEKQDIYIDKSTVDFKKIDREVSNSLLIESMGLTSLYAENQEKSSSELLISEKDFNWTNSFLRSSIKLISDCYPFLSLFVATGANISVAINSMIPLIRISSQIREIFDCFRDYGKYKKACERINNFLSLPQRDDNIQANSLLGDSLEEISFIDVDFKYQSNDNLTISKYSRNFPKAVINNLEGKNGSGKSTLLYIMIGLLKPTSGKVLVRFKKRGYLDLFKDVNLLEWREKIVCYCSHENLVDNDLSTGQKQSENISSMLQTKQTAQLFIFDEAGNALDNDRQEFLLDKIKKIIADGKVVFFVNHKMKKEDMK